MPSKHSIFQSGLLLALGLTLGCDGTSFTSSNTPKREAPPTDTATAVDTQSVETATAPTEPAPQAAVSKGSFTAWTTPTVPAPGQDYSIYVKVALPAGTKNYSLADLSGSIEGTDGYTQSLQNSVRQVGGVPPSYVMAPPDFKLITGGAQLAIRVPGATNQVRDTIHISSKLLGEQQVLRIDFKAP